MSHAAPILPTPATLAACMSAMEAAAAGRPDEWRGSAEGRTAAAMVALPILAAVPARVAAVALVAAGARCRFLGRTSPRGGRYEDLRPAMSDPATALAALGAAIRRQGGASIMDAAQAASAGLMLRSIAAMVASPETATTRDACAAVRGAGRVAWDGTAPAPVKIPEEAKPATPAARTIDPAAALARLEAEEARMAADLAAAGDSQHPDDAAALANIRARIAALRGPSEAPEAPAAPAPEKPARAKAPRKPRAK